MTDLILKCQNVERKCINLRSGPNFRGFTRVCLPCEIICMTKYCFFFLIQLTYKKALILALKNKYTSNTLHLRIYLIKRSIFVNLVFRTLPRHATECPT